MCKIPLSLFPFSHYTGKEGKLTELQNYMYFTLPPPLHCKQYTLLFIFLPIQEEEHKLLRCKALFLLLPFPCSTNSHLYIKLNLISQ